MELGFIPLALQFAISVASWMVKSRISSAAAAQYAAAEFEHFKRLSDGELTQISFEMAKQFPEYPYWEWFRILEDLRKYGVFTPGTGADPQPAPGKDPVSAPDPGPADKKKKDEVLLLLAAAGLLVILLTGR